MVEKMQSVNQYIDAILRRPTDALIATTYRGLSKHDYGLQPYIFRQKVDTENEHILLRELVAAHPDEFNSDATALELLVRMQHYSLPTRLLDVTWNPLVALYFACQSKRIKTSSSPLTESDGAVIIMNVEHAKVCYFDSDKVTCLANLARLNWAYKSKIDTSMDKDPFNAHTPIKRLIHFIRQDTHHFDPEIDPSDLDKIILVKPKQNNRRILAQNGAFFIFGLTQTLEDKNDFGISMNKIIIDADKKKDILSELDKLNINEKTLFPEVDRAAGYITQSVRNMHPTRQRVRLRPISGTPGP